MNKYWLIYLFYLLSFSSVLSQEHDRPKIALVLSGGGAKGFAHIGAIKVLEKEGIPIDIVVGTSMGSIVGGLYSIGYSAEEIETMVRAEDWGHLLSDNIPRSELSQNAKTEKQQFVISIPVYDKKPGIPHGAIKGQNVINLLSNLAGKVPVDASFSDFPRNFACIGTDLETGQQVIIDSGFLPTAIYSSMAIPGVFYPGEHNGHTMIDGGVVNNFPTDVAKAMGADIIIGIDIRNDLHSAKEIHTIESLMDQLINFYSIDKDSTNKSNCTILIRPDIAGFNASSFYSKAVDTLIERGIKAAEAALPEIRKLKTDYDLSPENISNELVKDDMWRIYDIKIDGSYSLNERLILDNINLKLPGMYRYDEIKAAVDRIYGLGCIWRVYFHLKDDGIRGNILHFTIQEKEASSINVGIRVNTTEAVSVLLNYSQRDYKRYIGYVSATADISSNPGFQAFGEISKGNFPVIGLELAGKYNKYGIYSEGEKINSAEIYYGTANIYSYQIIKRHANIGIGIKQDFFHGSFLLNPTDTIITGTKSKTAISNAYLYYSLDNLDDYYFPTRGSDMYAEASIAEDESFNNINPIILLKSRNYIPLSKHCTFLLNYNGRAIFSRDVPTFKSNFVGGHDHEIYFNNNLPFYGLPSLMPANRFTFIGLGGLRVQFAQKHYISLMANYLIQSNEIIEDIAYSSIWGIGAKYSYKSAIGPLDFTIGYSDWYKKPTMSANVGLWF